MPFDGHARASSSVHDWEDFLGMTNDDDDDDDDERTNAYLISRAI